jgi:putative ABC transport system substrate-binding protein
MLFQLDTPEAVLEQQEVQATAQVIGLRFVIQDVQNPSEIEPAFATIVSRGAGALYVGTGPFMTTHRERLVTLAARHSLPATYPLREFVQAGGLMSYGSSIGEAYRQAGLYTGRILRGEKPGDLPVMQATKFDLSLNMKTAKNLGLAIPDRVLALADEVIE